MSKQLFDDLAVHDHPAVKAWQQVSGTIQLPRQIERLFDDAKAKRKKRLKKKSALFRLVEALPTGGNIVAKRSQTKAALTELEIYQNALPNLDISKIEFYGSVPDDDPNFLWLLMEDAGAEPYEPHNLDHQLAAALWLGELHGQSSKLAQPDQRNVNELNQYLDYFMCGKQEIKKHVRNNAFTAQQKGLLENILIHLDIVERHWEEISQSCRPFPSCLVHSDFVPKNIRVRTALGEREILSFDWEKSDWCAPAVDLGCLNADNDVAISNAYWERIQKYWPQIELTQVEELTKAGVILRTLMGIYWASTHLSTQWPEGGLSKLVWYDKRFAVKMEDIGWT